VPTCSGRYQPGDSLPAEAALAAEHDVTRTVIRRALDVLCHEGLIVCEQGRRARVRREPPRSDVILSRGDEAIFRMPDQQERDHMGLEPGIPLVEVHRSDGSTETHRGDHTVIRAPALPGGAPSS
jgi:GntR family phosphonate transport system transcriptional regulator